MLARLANSQQPTFVDPQAAICWSANLQPQIKNTFKMGSLIGRGSGESFQLAFHGPGFVAVQPSEGQPAVATSCIKNWRRGRATGNSSALDQQRPRGEYGPTGDRSLIAEELCEILGQPFARS